MKTHTKLIIALAILMIYILSLAGMASALVVKSVSTNPAEIAPGETSVIEIELENDGENSIIDTSVVLDLKDVPFAPYGSSSEDSIDEIEEDEDETARFGVIALNNAKSGIYKIPMIISYDDGNSVKTRSSLISLTVNSKPVLGIEAEEGLLLKGVKNELAVRITNKGLSDVRFLEVELGSSSYTDLLSQKKVYIGDIDSDDFDSAGFQIFFKKNSPDKVIVPVTLNYMDATNSVKSESFDLVLNVYSREKAIELGLMKQSYTLYYIAGVVLVIVIFFVYRSWRKRKRLKRANSSEGF